MRTCTPGIRDTVRPLALQIRRQGSSRTPDQKVPPKIEQQPLDVRLMRICPIGLIRRVQLIRRRSQVRNLTYIDRHDSRNGRVVFDMLRELSCEDGRRISGVG